MRFRDRTDAGLRLASALERYRASRPLVVGIARGGVVVAAEVAKQLGVPLHLTVVRKLGHPAHPELGLGALAEDGVPVWNAPVLAQYSISEPRRYEVLETERAEMRQRKEKYRQGLLPPSLSGRTVLLVDDGLATGGSARAAAGFVRRRGAAVVVIAVPVGAPDVVVALREETHDVVALTSPAGLAAVGQCYARFDQVTDAAMIGLLRSDHGSNSSG